MLGAASATLIISQMLRLLKLEVGVTNHYHRQSDQDGRRLGMDSLQLQERE